MTAPAQRLRPLIERLARLSLSDDWAGELNPSQRAALRYLARANRFSRAPSHLAEYLGATRGTVSQTLAVLERKGMVTEARSETDRRRVSLELTETGRKALAGVQAIDEVLAELDEDQAAALEGTLQAILVGMVTRRGSRPFGLCRACEYHEVSPDGLRCRLLRLALAPEEAGMICHEQVPAARYAVLPQS